MFIRVFETINPLSFFWEAKKYTSVNTGLLIAHEISQVKVSRFSATLCNIQRRQRELRQVNEVGTKLLVDIVLKKCLAFKKKKNYDIVVKEALLTLEFQRTSNIFPSQSFL